MIQKALFLDRDGVINKLVNYDSGWDSPLKVSDVELVSGISEIITWCNNENIPVIEITNQPAVAKGKITLKISNSIETRIQKLLNKNGAKVNNIYKCLHHPNSVIKKYKSICDCRKPNAGLIIKAAKENNIDLNNSVFLGDKESDYLASSAAGCIPIIFLHRNDLKEKVDKIYSLKNKYCSENIEVLFNIIKNLLN